ncbi:MAG: transporter [Candidatus Tectomicrobia bacterium]|uniref:Transporter n=1 Tax=Tectimicrobiota bacterium TaxID=2528274 RepID=A0A932CN72_UNCTE|nr:transporter [Candidatus Tectomicrobia bacterium]
MKRSMAVLAVIIVLLLPRSESSAEKLADLIPGLYGGNGITLVPPSGFSRFDVEVDTVTRISQLGEHIASEMSLFPFGSSVGGLTFVFEEDLGTFVRTTESLGPLLAERAPTLGRGRLTLNLFSFTYFKYNRFNGEDLDHLRRVARLNADLIPPDNQRDLFELDLIRLNFDLDIHVRLSGLAATYGITDRFDVGILVPIVRVDMEVKSRAEIIPSPENPIGVLNSFDHDTDPPNDIARGSATGLGDIVLRAKYHLLKSEVVDIAGVVLARLETGDERDFLGTGATTLRPFLVLSRTLFGKLTPHLNIGYEFNLDRRDKNAIRYALGFDAGTPWLTVAGDLLGIHESNGDGIGDDLVTASLGAKWNPWKKFLLSGNLQFPLNKDGLRSNLIATFGVEYAF